MQISNTPKKLFNLPVLVLITISLLFLLFVLFPWKTLTYLNFQNTTLLKEQFSSRLKTKYYLMLNSENISNSDIITLSQTLRDEGLWKYSSMLLKKKININKLNKQQHQQYMMILLDNYVDAYHASVNKKERIFLKNKVRSQLINIEDFTHLSNQELQTLAELSSDFGLYPLASKFYYQLANKNTTYRSQWFAEAGKNFNQSEDYKSAAEAFKLAGNFVNTEIIYNEFTNDWLTALVKSNQLDQVALFIDNFKQQLPKSHKAIETIANIAIQAGFPEQASYFFAYLAKNDPLWQQRWYEKAAYWASNAENYEDAATYLINAEKITTSDNEKWYIKQRLIDIYVKAKMPEKALALILPLIENNPKNLKLLDQAIDISLKNKNLATARKLNKLYLSQNPDSINALNRQVNIEAFDKNYKQAINYIKRVVRITPNKLEPREQWANLAEQEGNKDTATDLWQWIYKYSNNDKHLKKLISTAQANINGNGLAVLQKIAREESLPKQAAYDVFFHLIRKNKKTLGEKFLTSYLSHHKPDRSLLKILAKWYSGERRYTLSLKTWNKIEQKYGTTRTTSLNKFELFWLLNKKRKAYRLWLKNKTSWNKKANRRQLSIMAEIAWRYKHYRQSLSYYKRLINNKYKRPLRERIFQYMRIALLQKKLGKPKSALATFRKGFINTSSLTLLINGLQLSFDRHDEYYFKSFTKLAKKHKNKVKLSSRYWLLQAAHAQRNKSYKTALRHYKRVLSLKPKSREARLGIRAIRKL